jgi:hypothetical protein
MRKYPSDFWSRLLLVTYITGHGRIRDLLATVSCSLLFCSVAPNSATRMVRIKRCMFDPQHCGCIFKREHGNQRLSTEEARPT